MTVIFHPTTSGNKADTILLGYNDGSGSRTASRGITGTTGAVITSFSPTSAPIGGIVYVYGSGFTGSTAIAVNGGAWCWGRNHSGALGNNSTTNSSIPVQVSGLEWGVQSISIGDTHTCALVNGSAGCWGRNDSGQLGNNSTTDSLVPVNTLLMY